MDLSKETLYKTGKQLEDRLRTALRGYAPSYRLSCDVDLAEDDCSIVERAYESRSSWEVIEENILER